MRRRIRVYSLVTALALTICGALNETASAQYVIIPFDGSDADIPANHQAGAQDYRRSFYSSKAFITMRNWDSGPCMRGLSNLTTSAFWFDVDGDGRLSKPETQFLLQTIAQQQFVRTLSSNNEVVEAQRLQFVNVFRQLALQYDRNHDGDMERHEFSLYATQLIDFLPQLGGQECANSVRRNSRRVQPDQPRLQLSVYSQTQQANGDAYQGFNLNPALPVSPNRQRGVGNYLGGLQQQMNRTDAGVEFRWSRHR